MARNRACLTIAGAIDDLGESRPLWYVVLGFLAGLSCAWFILAYFTGLLIGGAILPIALLASGWFAVDTIHDLRTLKPDPDLSDRQNRVIEVAGTVVYLALFVPALALGIITGARQW